ncbi:Glycosyl transferase family 21 [Halorubrum aquaticum]|uniref:Glycosyl transferase family 21 n=1 Tax=Halorubrum aquaticum TaxID=387340 RepID=A0A1I3BUC5_9EURY|nr:glycosyltransferase [Halorubrum aquaticum]SFH65351.1 Glycosyl transferase family 21 [Halorubrum aquaticum]
MTDPPPTSVLLPTVRWTDACEEVAAMLAEDDELLVIADDADDPVADRRGETPEGVRVVLAGEPDGCSGKANAIAAGMAAAEGDRIVWTDDDFRHPPGWLADLHADYERQGPTTELPVFVGRDPLGTLLEPAYLIGGTLAVAAGGIAWGGAVVFERADLDEAAFIADLRRTVSDDGTLSEHLEVTPVKRTRVVPAGGSIRASLERFVRFLWIVRYHAPRASAVNVALAVAFSTLCLAAPVLGIGFVTLLSGATYAWAGLRRPTFLLAGPAAIAMPAMMAYAFARRTFTWGGRRYRWVRKDDVRVLSE